MEIQKIQSVNLTGLCPGYRADVKRFLNFSGGSFTAAAVESFFDDMERRGLKAATIQRHRAAIKKALLESIGTGATLAELAKIDAFFKQIKIAKTDARKLKEDMMDARELRQIVKNAGPKTALILRALYQSACRISELVSMKLSDCDETAEGVKIRIIGKGRKERFVFMRKETFHAIREAYQGKVYLFEREGKPLSKFTVYALVKRAGRKIGRADIHPHTLRHSWASINVETQGLSATSQYLGHADASTTARYYLHGMPSMSAVLGAAII